MQIGAWHRLYFSAVWLLDSSCVTLETQWHLNLIIVSKPCEWPSKATQNRLMSKVLSVGVGQDSEYHTLQSKWNPTALPLYLHGNVPRLCGLLQDWISYQEQKYNVTWQYLMLVLKAGLYRLCGLTCTGPIIISIHHRGRMHIRA